MEWTPRVGQAAEQAAGATPVLGITLQNFPPLERCQDFIQANLLFDHLLLRVLRHPQEAGCGLGFDPLKLPPIRPHHGRSSHPEGITPARPTQTAELVATLNSLFELTVGS
jgi:hypothetical protein